MTPSERNEVIEVIAQEVDLLTPGAAVSKQANRVLADEFIEEYPDVAVAAVVRAQQPDGSVSPWIIERELLTRFIEHCRTRIRPRDWSSRD